MTARPAGGPDAPVRDQRGHPLPGADGESGALAPDQVDDALAALPGWHRRGATLARTVRVPADSLDALREGVRTVTGTQSHVTFDEGEDGVTLLVGAAAGDLTAADIEAAARIDTVLSGSGTDRGTGR